MWSLTGKRVLLTHVMFESARNWTSYTRKVIESMSLAVYIVNVFRALLGCPLWMENLLNEELEKNDQPETKHESELPKEYEMVLHNHVCPFPLILNKSKLPMWYFARSFFTVAYRNNYTLEHDIDGVFMGALEMLGVVLAHSKNMEWSAGMAPMELRLAWAMCLTAAYKFEFEDDVNSISLYSVQSVLTNAEIGEFGHQIRNTVAKYEVYLALHCGVFRCLRGNVCCLARSFILHLGRNRYINEGHSELGARCVFFFSFWLHSETGRLRESSNYTSLHEAVALVVLACIKVLDDSLLLRNVSIPCMFDVAIELSQFLETTGRSSQVHTGGVFLNTQSLEHRITHMQTIHNANQILHSERASF